MKQTKSLLLLLLVLLTSNANALQIDVHVEYQGGYSIDFTGTVPDSYTWVNNWNHSGTGLVWDTLVGTAVSEFFTVDLSSYASDLWIDNNGGENPIDGVGDDFQFSYSQGNDDLVWSLQGLSHGWGYCTDIECFQGGVYFAATSASFVVTPTSVPEPSVVALMSLGLIGLVGTSKRKKK